MEMTIIDQMMIPMIVVACLCIGYVLKNWMPTDNKWIPTILLILGATSGIILFGLDYEGIVKGMVSGLAAVGLHQAFKQHLQLPELGDLDCMGPGEDEDLLEIDEEPEDEDLEVEYLDPDEEDLDDLDEEEGEDVTE